MWVYCGLVCLCDVLVAGDLRSVAAQQRSSSLSPASVYPPMAFWSLPASARPLRTSHASFQTTSHAPISILKNFLGQSIMNSTEIEAAAKARVRSHSDASTVTPPTALEAALSESIQVGGSLGSEDEAISIIGNYRSLLYTATGTWVAPARSLALVLWLSSFPPPFPYPLPLCDSLSNYVCY